MMGHLVRRCNDGSCI